MYDIVPPSEKVVKPAGEWNSVELMINHKTNQGHVIQNGTKIVEFPVEGPEWDELIANSKFTDWEDFAAFKASAKANHDAALMLIAAAEAEDMTTTKNALGQLGGTCKACHQQFKGW